MSIFFPIKDDLKLIPPHPHQKLQEWLPHLNRTGAKPAVISVMVMWSPEGSWWLRRNVRSATLSSVNRGENMITPLSMDCSPVFRSIYCPQILGQRPLHRWQMNCLACDRYSLVRWLAYGGSVWDNPESRPLRPVSRKGFPTWSSCSAWSGENGSVTWTGKE